VPVRARNNNREASPHSLFFPLRCRRS
jgi:hypothetical protein